MYALRNTLEGAALLEEVVSGTDCHVSLPLVPENLGWRGFPWLEGTAGYVRASLGVIL
jgi:hypothetical protein